MNLYWPVFLIVLSNVFYHICSKSTPSKLDPFASLTVTYLIGAAVSALAFFLFNPKENLFAQYKNLNRTSFVLGIAIVGLEAGSIYMYKAGWNISTGQIVCSSLLTVCLLAVGRILYHESVSITKVAGLLICLVGLFLINKQ